MPEQQKPALRNPSSYLGGLERTNEFLGAVAKTGDRATSLGRAAAVFGERMASEPSLSIEKQRDMFAVQLLARLPDFLRAQLASRQEEYDRSAPRLSKAEHDRNMSHVIGFNHTLHDMIDMFPELKVNDITRFIKTAALDMYGPKEAAFADQSTREALVGMQHEIGLKQILWQIEDVEDVIEADEAQERRGIDLIVHYRGTELAVDAKAAQKSADKAYDKWFNNHQAGRQGGYPIWTRINYEDFGGGFRITDERAKQLAPYIQAELEQLYVAQVVAV